MHIARIGVLFVAVLCPYSTRSWAQGAKHEKASESGDPVLVGAGDIASCDDLAGAEATRS